MMKAIVKSSIWNITSQIKNEMKLNKNLYYLIEPEGNVIRRIALFQFNRREKKHGQSESQPDNQNNCHWH